MCQVLKVTTKATAALLPPTYRLRLVTDYLRYDGYRMQNTTSVSPLSFYFTSSFIKFGVDKKNNTYNCIIIVIEASHVLEYMYVPDIRYIFVYLNRYMKSNCSYCAPLCRILNNNVLNIH